MLNGMRIELGSLNRTQRAKVVLLGLALSTAPFLLGEFLGLGAFVVTPVVGAAMAVFCGTLAPWIAPQAPWKAGSVLALTVALTYVGIFCAILVTLAVINGEGILSGLKQMAIAAAVSLVPIAAASVCIALGVWVRLRTTRPSVG